MSSGDKNKSLGTIGTICLVIGLLAGGVKCFLDFSEDTAKVVSPTYNKISTSISDASGDNTEKILSEDADVKLGSLSISKDEYGYVDSELKLTVTNKTNEKKSFYFNIEAVDESGNRVMIDYVYANDLAAGQSAEYKVFTYIESDKIDAMKKAKIKISEASMS